METKKSPLSIRVIYWLTNISLGLTAFAFLLILLLNILLYTTDFGKEMQIQTELPVQVDFLEKGSLFINDQLIEVELVDATSKIHFIDTPEFITKKVGFVILLLILGMGYLTWIFRTFIRNVKNGEIFTIKNIGILKKLSYGIAGFWLFTNIYMRVYYYLIVKHLKFENIHFTGDISNYNELLLMALFIWMLAHIFIVGLKLQQEKELTI